MQEKDLELEKALKELEQQLAINDTEVELHVNVFARVNEGAHLLEKKSQQKEVFMFVSFAMALFVMIGVLINFIPSVALFILVGAFISTIVAIPFAIKLVKGSVIHE